MAGKTPIIDFHVHFGDPKLAEASRGKTVQAGFGTRPVPQSAGISGRSVMYDPAAQIEDMDAHGVDMHVISLSTVGQGTSWASLDEEAPLITRINDKAAEWVAAYPKRYVGSFVLPLRDVDAAMAEFERCTTQLKLNVANLCCCYGDKYIGHPSFDPFWKAAEASGTTIFIHPDGTRDLWYQDYSLWNSIGQSIEEAKVMASIIYEGVFEKFPGIKIVVSHGAGYFPHYMGRLDRNFREKPNTTVNITKTPSAYLKNFYYDTCTYDLGVIEQLVKIVGTDRIVMGSDYPVGDTDPVGFVKSAPGIKAAAQDAVLGGTAARLLGM